MFTGLIREMGEVKSFANNTLTLKAKHKAQLGDSIAINGVCLSVTQLHADGFSVELSPETQNTVAMENWKERVHIEPAMQMGDRFEGHIVQGHVDTIGVIESITNSGNSFDVMVKVDKKHLPYIVPKGSITIDGISLTVNDVHADTFRLTIIPITMRETLFSTYKKGSRVNVETDMFARYISHILNHQKDAMSWDDVDQIMSTHY